MMEVIGVWEEGT
jgi:hypothetical protein